MLNGSRRTRMPARGTAVGVCAFVLTASLAAMVVASSSEPATPGAVTPTLAQGNISRPDEPAAGLSYTFLFAEPTVKERTLLGTAYTDVLMEGSIPIGQAIGAPALPAKPVKLLLPPGTQVASLDVVGEPVAINTRDNNLTEKPVVPYQSPVVIGAPAPTRIAFDSAVYSSSAAYPSSRFFGDNVAYCRGYAVLSLTLNPVQYSPAAATLAYYPEMTVQITLAETQDANPFYRGNAEDEEWLRSLVYNPELIPSYPQAGRSPTEYPGGLCDPSDQYDYVIITTTYNGLDWWPAVDPTPYNWESLMNKHEVEDGLTCTLVTVQQIYAEPDYENPVPLFNDNPARIREFCRDAYQDWGTAYILIGGDDEWIPARHMKYDYEGNVDSDLYWSNLDNSFNEDQDSYWGEEGDDGFDLYAELFIGRITCDVPQDVSNWLTKSFYYADSTFEEYLDNAAFYGGNTGWPCEGDDFIDYSAIKGLAEYLGPNPEVDWPYPAWLGFQYGFETWNSENPGMEYDLSVKWTAEPPNEGWLGGSESGAITGLRNAINADEATLISAIAHANEDMSMDVGRSTWESEYHNTMPFFVHDYGCHCGDMDAADDGVLHSMLFHSDVELAFACVFNTCYGWGNFESTNSSSALQQKSFWDYLFDTANNSGGTMNWQMGKAQAWSKDNMAPTIDWTTSGAPGSWRGVIQGCLLFGDPAQRIKPPVQPEHNVGIQTLDVSAHEPADTDIWVGATLYNNGKHDETDVEVRFLVDAVEVDSTVIAFFEEGTLEEIGWAYHTPTFGWETLCVNVTPVPEEDILLDNEKCVEVIYGPDIAVSEIDAPEYLGQGFAKPVKGYVDNVGPTDETVTVEFSANSIFEDSTTVFLASGAGEWVTFMWDGTNSGLGTYDVTIHAVPVENEYYLSNQSKSQSVTVFAALGSILLVDDDDGDSYEGWYEDALLAANYVYETWDRSSQGSPTPSVMEQYSAVVWFTGYDYGVTLSATDQTNLAAYLDGGGRLFISGQDIGYDIGGSSFYSNYLHANYQVDSAGWNVSGESGDPIGDGFAFGISSGDGANNQDWPDGISPISPATSCLYYSDATPHKAAIKVEEGAYKLVYFSFGFEAIDNMPDRTEVMSRVLDWLEPIPRTSCCVEADCYSGVTQYECEDVMEGLFRAGMDCGDLCAEDQDCEDGNPCTVDTCYCGDPESDAIGCVDHQAEQGASCDDGVYCNGVDTCDGQGTCIHAGDPCEGGEECNQVCSDETENCYDPPGTLCGDGPTDCSGQDTCDGAGYCNPNNSGYAGSCDDGEECTVDDQCVSGECQGTYVVRIYADVYPVPGGDGAVEGGDILCVLDAASGYDTHGCLTVLPSGYEAGDINPCDPDGAVEGFDILAVLDAANDMKWCEDPCPPLP